VSSEPNGVGTLQFPHPQNLALTGHRQDPIGANIAVEHGKEHLAVVLGRAAA
jgi:hypothetical protein